MEEHNSTTKPISCPSDWAAELEGRVFKTTHQYLVRCMCCVKVRWCCQVQCNQEESHRLSSSIITVWSTRSELFQNEKARALLREFKDVVSVGGGDLGRAELVYHRIDTGDAPPIRQPAWTLPFHERGMSAFRCPGVLWSLVSGHGHHLLLL